MSTVVSRPASPTAKRADDVGDGKVRKEKIMCASCGCGQPNDDHGNSANITLQDVERAGEAAGVSKEQAAENIRSCCSG